VSLGRQQREFLDAVLAEKEPGDPRLAIYHRSARANRVAALAAAYPVVRRLVGQAFFDEAAARYGDTFPSRSGDLNVFGARFAAFLDRYPHAQGLPYLADVARLEWAVHESRLSAPGEALDYLALGAVPAGDLGRVIFRLRPSVRLVASPHPILSIWQANQDDRDGTPERTQGPEHVAVRVDATLEPVPLAVEPAEWALLQAFERGESLAQAAAGCAEQGWDLEAALATLATLHVLAGFDLVPA
jgi:hypothetical protein